MDYKVEPLNKTHVRNRFLNQHPGLQSYIRNIAGQDVKKKVAQCFVLTQGNNVVLGYYTLSNASIPRDQVSEDFIKKNKLPPYKSLPVTLIGRLAVDTSSAGKGFGDRLLMDSLYRSYLASKVVASFAVIVDYIDKEAKDFYLHYGFPELKDVRRLFIPMKYIEKIVEEITLAGT